MNTPKIYHDLPTGMYRRFHVETDPILTDADKEALHEWATENLPPWEWMDSINEEQTAWEFVVETVPEDR